MGLASLFLIYLHLALLKINGSTLVVLVPFRLETVCIVEWKTSVLLYHSLIFTQHGIVAGILFDEKFRCSLKRKTNDLGSPIDNPLGRPLPKTNAQVFLLLFALIIPLIFLQLKGLISFTSFSSSKILDFSDPYPTFQQFN